MRKYEKAILNLWIRPASDQELSQSLKAHDMLQWKRIIFGMPRHSKTLFYQQVALEMFKEIVEINKII